MTNSETQLTCEVLVYGGTVAGIAAALSAARQGCDTILIERGDHFGGMMASGLGAIDSLRENAFGGIFYEFLTKVREYYVETYGRESDQYRMTYDGFFMEPHVAEQILKQMLDSQESLRCFKRTELRVVEKQEQQVRGSTYLNRTNRKTVRISHQVAIDGTYEGDFAAMSGARYFLGREGRKDHGERFAGEIFFDPRYYKQEVLPESSGEASPYMQANCFRLTLSDNEKRVRFEKPEGYKDLYEQYYRWLLQDFDKGRIRHLYEIIWSNPLANHKFCMNGHIEALTSLNLTEFSVEWADGDWEKRTALFERYKAYTLGLYYFLGNDPAVPLVPRIDASRFGLAHDEYQAEGNVPWQLYVRQGRRLAGEYVVTEHDSIPKSGRQRPEIHKDTIAVYEHGFDSHPCRNRTSQGAVRTASDGYELIEGVIYFKSKYRALNRPASVPYRAIVPEVVDGLLVPAALSATSVAYSSIRMEPVWMATGQAAGNAAALAIDASIQVRKVNAGDLQKALVSQGQVLCYFTDLSLSDPAFASIQLQAIEENPANYEIAAGATK